MYLLHYFLLVGEPVILLMHPSISALNTSGEVYEILKSILQIYVRMSNLWLWVVFIVERLINILVLIANFFIYFL